MSGNATSRMRRRFFALSGVLLLSLWTGACGEDARRDAAVYPVSGQVVVDGKPAEGVVVRLHLLNHYRDLNAPRPTATTDASGRFQLKSEVGEPGAPAGHYVATFLWPAAAGGKDRFAGAFAEPEESGHTVVVENQSVELPPFTLRMKRPR